MRFLLDVKIFKILNLLRKEEVRAMDIIGFVVRGVQRTQKRVQNDSRKHSHFRSQVQSQEAKVKVPASFCFDNSEL